MTDFLFCLQDNHFYSNTLSDWSSIKEGQKIELINLPESYTVVKNDVISFFKDIKVINNNTLEVISPDKGIALDGDNLDVYFEVLGLSLADIQFGGNKYKTGDLLILSDNTVHDHEYGGKDYAELRVTESVDGAVVNLDIEYEGQFIKAFENATLSGGSGSGCIISPLFHQREKKLHKLFTVLDSQYQIDKTRITIAENIKDAFEVGEIITKRYRLTINENCNYKLEHYPFIAVVKNTPYLNLPLANKENIAQLYNQAILTIDQKLKDLS